MTDDSLLREQLDEYRLEKLLGRGGMARVYLGLDTRLGRYAAIKVIDSPLRADPEYVQRFEREAQAIAKLEHPHIIRLYRYGEAHDVLYMAMQYIEGADLGFVLQTYRDDGEFIEREEASRIIRQVCQALDYAHAQGVIHRDIKPSNILLDKQGQVYLADFGLALLTEIGTQGTIFGSPYYIAPEQAISSAGVVPQSDLYSVGVILYEMFTGRLPFDASNAVDLALMHLSDPPTPPHELRPEISPQMTQVVLKALAKEPRDRYPNGVALADALDQAIAHQQVNMPASGASTLAHKSIPERVSLDVRAVPLPPPPVQIVPAPAGPTKRPQAVIVSSRAFVADLQRKPYLPGCLAGIMVLFIALGLIITAVMVLLPRLLEDDPDERTSGQPTTIENPTPTIAAGRPVTQTAAPTFTPPPMMTAPPAATPSQPAGISPMAPAAGTRDYVILVARQGGDSLFVINQGEVAFPLAPLRLGEGQGSVAGQEWGVDTLEPGQCVAVWSKADNPQSPAVDCTLVGTPLTRGNANRFWTSAFKIRYGQQLETVCESDWCSLTRLRRNGD